MFHFGLYIDDAKNEPFSKENTLCSSMRVQTSEKQWPCQAREVGWFLNKSEHVLRVLELLSRLPVLNNKHTHTVQ